MDPDISFDDILAELTDETRPFRAELIYRLSNPGPEALNTLKKTWPEIEIERRRQIAQIMRDLAEDDLLLIFEPIALFGIEDVDPTIRLACVDLLWQHEALGLDARLLSMAEGDEDYQVRAAAAVALGHFIYRGSLDEFSAEKTKTIEDLLISIAGGEDHPMVRRRALESLSFSSRPEVPNLIEDAYGAEDESWLVSALYAMGRSSHARWRNDVILMLDHENDDVRRAAVEAAGELVIQEAVPTLVELLEDPEDDVRTAVIWALSLTGGDGVADLLSDLIDTTEDEELVDYIEAAIENLVFTEDILTFSLFDFEENDLDPSGPAGENSG
jgi:hypothetical protein